MKKTNWKHRILGCLSFSLITHLGLIAAAFVLPGFANDSSQKASAPTVSNSAMITSSEATPSTSQAEAPVEIVQAAAEAAPQPEEKPQVIASNDPLPVKDTDVVAPALPTHKSSPKLATALPSKHSKMIKDTADDADVKLKQALLDSRGNEKSRPEVAGDIPLSASVVAQNNMPEQLPPDATFPEDSSAGLSTPPVQAAPVPPQKQAQVAPAPSMSAHQQAQQKIAAAVTAEQGQQTQPAQAIAPISKSGQLGSAAPSKGVIRNGDDLKEAPGNIRPVYPLTDRRAGKQGTVVFLARLTPDGQVIDIRIEKSSSSPTLDNAAYSAFRTYRYQSGQEGMVRKAFTFALKGEAVEAPVARR